MKLKKIHADIKALHIDKINNVLSCTLFGTIKKKADCFQNMQRTQTEILVNQSLGYVLCN